MTGPDVGKTFSVGSVAAGIGRDASNEIALTDTIISRCHGRLEVTVSGVVVFIDSSRNGTYWLKAGSTKPDATILNSCTIMRVGDMLMLGHTTLRLEPSKEWPGPAAAAAAGLPGLVAAAAPPVPPIRERRGSATGAAPLTPVSSRPTTPTSAAFHSARTGLDIDHTEATPQQSDLLQMIASQIATHPLSTGMDGSQSQAIGVDSAGGQRPGTLQQGSSASAESLPHLTSSVAVGVFHHPFTQLAITQGKAGGELRSPRSDDKGADASAAVAASGPNSSGTAAASIGTAAADSVADCTSAAVLPASASSAAGAGDGPALQRAASAATRELVGLGSFSSIGTFVNTEDSNIDSSLDGSVGFQRLNSGVGQRIGAALGSGMYDSVANMAALQLADQRQNDSGRRALSVTGLAGSAVGPPSSSTPITSTSPAAMQGFAYPKPVTTAGFGGSPSKDDTAPRATSTASAAVPSLDPRAATEFEGVAQPLQRPLQAQVPVLGKPASIDRGRGVINRDESHYDTSDLQVVDGDEL